MSDTDFRQAQHAVETITSQYRSLREQDVTHSAAIDFIVLEHGLQDRRGRVVAIVNDYLAEVVGQSGEQFTAVVATPSTAASPGGVVHCPDTLSEDWS